MSYLAALVRPLRATGAPTPLVRPSDALTAGAAPGPDIDTHRPADAAATVEEPSSRPVRPPPATMSTPPSVPPGPAPPLAMPLPPEAASGPPRPRATPPTGRPAPPSAPSPSPAPAAAGPPVPAVERVEVEHRMVHEVVREQEAPGVAAPTGVVEVIRPLVRAPVVVPTPPPAPVAAGRAAARAAVPAGVAAEPATPSAPAVHISIGRVVVRAEPGPDRPTPGRGSEPTHSSLDDYLTSREERAR